MFKEQWLFLETGKSPNTFSTENTVRCTDLRTVFFWVSYENILNLVQIKSVALRQF